MHLDELHNENRIKETIELVLKCSNMMEHGTCVHPQCIVLVLCHMVQGTCSSTFKLGHTMLVLTGNHAVQVGHSLSHLLVHQMEHVHLI